MARFVYSSSILNKICNASILTLIVRQCNILLYQDLFPPQYMQYVPEALIAENTISKGVYEIQPWIHSCSHYCSSITWATNAHLKRMLAT